MAIFNTIVFFLFLFFYEETKYIHVCSGVNQSITVDLQVSGKTTGSNLEIIASPPDSADMKQVSTHEYKAQLHINHDIPLNSYKQRLRWTTKTDESLLKMFYQPFIVLFQFPHIMFTALQYASGVVWLTVMSAIMSISFAAPPYNFSSAGIGYLSLGPFIGNTIGSIYGGFLGDWSIRWLSRRNNGYFEPEFRLYLLHLPAIFMSGGLIMFGATIDRVSFFEVLLNVS